MHPNDDSDIRNEVRPMISVRDRVAPAAFLAILVLLAIAFLPAPSKAASPAAPQSYVQAMFSLEHPAGLDKFVKSVTSPNSKKYRQYKPVKWIVKKYGASKKTKKRALRWLAERGIEGRVDATGTAVLAKMTPEQSEGLVADGASVSSVKDGGAGQVPPGLEGVVETVGFLDTDPDKFKSLTALPPQPAGSRFPNDSSARPHSGTASGCAAGQASIVPPGYGPFTPNQYLDAYGYSKLHKQGFKGQGMRIAVVEIDGFKRSDIETFGKCFGIDIPPTKVVLSGIKKPLAPGPETTLDLSVLSAVAPKLKSIDVYEGGGAEVQIMLSTGMALGKPGTKPDAISISLGACEAQLGQQLQYRRGLDNIFAVAAGAGISVLVAAGDNGSANCSTDGNASTLPLLAASDPSTSPYVTAVGGTNFELKANNQISKEFVWNDGPLGPNGGGGGFSILAPTRPWYQQGTKRFKNYGLTRAVPDVAALGDSAPGYAIYCTAPGADVGCVHQSLPEGGWQNVGGTSAATPLTAAGLTLLAQKARKAGQKPIGFANPLLYKLGKSKASGSVFTDIVAGNNDVGKAIPAAQGGGTPLGCCSALKGFDTASGWGSIKAIGLAKAAAKANPKRSK